MMQELNYIRCGDYYIPDIRLPEETRPIGRWGRMHRDYIKEHNPIRFNDLCLSGELWTYLADINEQAQTRLELGREVKRADIAIMDKDRPMVPYIIVELKKPKLTDGKEQLKSYCNATGAPIGVWTNGEQISCYNRKDPNFFEEISDIPKASQKLSDIINEKFTYEDLKRKDKISTQKKSLRSLIKEMEDEVLASAGVDSFEEIFKLIFAKLYDELICANDPTAYLQFRNNGNTDYELKEKIQGLFQLGQNYFLPVDISLENVLTGKESFFATVDFRSL